MVELRAEVVFCKCPRVVVLRYGPPVVELEKSGRLVEFGMIELPLVAVVLGTNVGVVASSEATVLVFWYAVAVELKYRVETVVFLYSTECVVTKLVTVGVGAVMVCREAPTHEHADA